MLQGSIEGSDGMRLRTWRGGSGSGPTLLLVPGFLGDVDIFAAIEHEIGNEMRLLSWDLRGFDQAVGSRTAERVDIVAHARDGLAVVAANGAEQVILVGHSAGGPIAAEIFRLAPERFSGFVSICGIWGGPVERILRRWLEPAADTVPWMLAMGAFVGRGHSLPKWLRESVRTRAATKVLHLSGMLGECVDDRPIQELLARTAARDSGAVAAAWAALARQLIDGQRPEISVPSLWIAGKRDPIAGPMVARLAAATATHATIIPIRGGGHFLPLEQPELLALQLRRFIAEKVHPSAVQSAAT